MKQRLNCLSLGHCRFVDVEEGSEKIAGETTTGPVKVNLVI